MGAFLNKVIDFQDDEDGVAVPDAFWYTLERQAELVIDQLTRARRAELVESDWDEETAPDGEEDERGGGPPDDDERGGGPPDDDEDERGGGPTGDEGRGS